MIDPQPPVSAGEVPFSRPAPPQRRKKPEDTSQGCRDFAAADLDRAAGITGGHARGRYEYSAEVWTARANLLARLEAKTEARMRAAAR